MTIIKGTDSWRLIRFIVLQISWQHWQISKILHDGLFVKYFKVTNSDQIKKYQIIIYRYTAYFHYRLSYKQKTNKQNNCSNIWAISFIWYIIWNVFIIHTYSKRAQNELECLKRVAASYWILWIISGVLNWIFSIGKWHYTWISPSFFFHTLTFVAKS